MKVDESRAVPHHCTSDDLWKWSQGRIEFGVVQSLSVCDESRSASSWGIKLHGGEGWTHGSHGSSFLRLLRLQFCDWSVTCLEHGQGWGTKEILFGAGVS